MDVRTAASAFSKQAVVFDDIDAGNPLIGWVRDRVRAQARREMEPGDTLLELNAGTGIDSAYFAGQGLHVLATDAAEGMIGEQVLKQRDDTSPKWETMLLSFHDLDKLGERRFQHVFSNFGGLNCTDRLDLVLRGIDRALLPGGTCTLVIMPRFSPWELAAILKLNFTFALRRWRRKGTVAHVEGIPFLCHYYGPGYVHRHLGDGYTILDQRALSLVVPPPHHGAFPLKWPRLFRLLERIEDSVATLPVLRNWGDHFVITLRKKT